VVQVAALDVLVQPLAEARPFAQQRLVRDLDLALADREQTAVGELVEHGPRLLVELLERDPGAHDCVSLTLSGQAQQNAPRDPPALGVQPLRRRSRPAARRRRARPPACS